VHSRRVYSSSRPHQIAERTIRLPSQPAFKEFSALGDGLGAPSPFNPPFEGEEKYSVL
jgi:hypothetical protein